MSSRARPSAPRARDARRGAGRRRRHGHRGRAISAVSSSPLGVRSRVRALAGPPLAVPRRAERRERFRAGEQRRIAGPAAACIAGSAHPRSVSIRPSWNAPAASSNATSARLSVGAAASAASNRRRDSACRPSSVSTRAHATSSPRLGASASASSSDSCASPGVRRPPAPGRVAPAIPHARLRRRPAAAPRRTSAPRPPATSPRLRRPRGSPRSPRRRPAVRSAPRGGRARSPRRRGARFGRRALVRASRHAGGGALVHRTADQRMPERERAAVLAGRAPDRRPPGGPARQRRRQGAPRRPRRARDRTARRRPGAFEQGLRRRLQGGDLERDRGDQRRRKLAPAARGARAGTERSRPRRSRSAARSSGSVTASSRTQRVLVGPAAPASSGSHPGAPSAASGGQLLGRGSRAARRTRAACGRLRWPAQQMQGQLQRGLVRPVRVSRAAARVGAHGRAPASSARTARVNAEAVGRERFGLVALPSASRAAANGTARSCSTPHPCSTTIPAARAWSRISVHQGGLAQPRPRSPGRAPRLGFPPTRRRSRAPPLRARAGVPATSCSSRRNPRLPYSPRRGVGGGFPCDDRPWGERPTGHEPNQDRPADLPAGHHHRRPRRCSGADSFQHTPSTATVKLQASGLYARVCRSRRRSRASGSAGSRSAATSCPRRSARRRAPRSRPPPPPGAARRATR